MLLKTYVIKNRSFKEILFWEVIADRWKNKFQQKHFVEESGKELEKCNIFIHWTF